MKNTQLTVSLVLYNENIEEIEGLISDIRGITLNTKLFILDNSIQKKDLSQLEDAHTEVIYSDENLGYGRGHNVCIAKAIETGGAECHLIVNPDIRFRSDDISILYDYVISHENIGIVIPSVYYEDSSFQYIYKLLPDPLTMFVRYAAKYLPSVMVEKANYNYEMRFKNFNNEFELPVVSGCFMFCRSKALKEVNGFDDRFFMYFEDVDLSRRIGENYKNLYLPGVKITHGFNKASYKSLKLMKHILLVP